MSSQLHRAARTLPNISSARSLASARSLLSPRSRSSLLPSGMSLSASPAASAGRHVAPSLAADTQGLRRTLTHNHAPSSPHSLHTARRRIASLCLPQTLTASALSAHSCAACSTAGLTAPHSAAFHSNARPLSANDTSSPFPSQAPGSAFLTRSNKWRDAGMAEATVNAAATQATAPLPSHIHSATCGCETKNAGGEEDKELGESFMSDLQAGIRAAQASSASVATEEGGQNAAPSTSASASPPASSTKEWSLGSMLVHNHRFVREKSYERYLTDKYPFKRIAVISCMDTRLTELLPRALDLKNGDAKIIKVAGAMVAHPFGSVMRSILVAVYGLGAEHIIVVGHHDCGMTGMDSSRILAQAKQRGIPESTFATLSAAGLNLDGWLSGFKSVESSVRHSVDIIRNHPLLNFKETTLRASEAIASGAAAAATPSPPTPGSSPLAQVRIPKITVTGLVIDPTTGKLDLVTPPDDDTMRMLHENNIKISDIMPPDGHRQNGPPSGRH